MSKLPGAAAQKDAVISLFTKPHVWLKFLWKSFKFNKAYGVFPSPVEVVTSLTEMNVTYTSKEFQPHSEVLDYNKFRFLGSIIEPRGRDESFPYERLENTRVIYISMGTVYTTNAQFFKNCFEALKDMKDVTVVVSLGSNLRLEDLGEIPSNFLIKEFIPQIDVLKVAELFISHAGNNSINESLGFACPMILCPQQGEQTIGATQVVRLGAGVNTNQKCPSSDMIKKSVKKILSDDSYKKNALKASIGLRKARESESLSSIITSYVTN